MSEKRTIKEKGHDKISQYRSNPDGWNMFIEEILKVSLDDEQKDIVRGVQYNKMVSVASGTARGKDFTAACIALAFMYLTPKWDAKKKDPTTGLPELIENTKVIMTAPTDRQVGDIMYPEIIRHFNRAGILPGRKTGYDIRTDWEEWFLTGFKADEHNTEAWTGMHAANIMFIVTEGSGIAQKIFEAIEGNLQGNSRLLIIFNRNSAVGYAAESQKSKRFVPFRLNSLNAPNVVNKKMLIPGQVDWDWVNDKVEAWCTVLTKDEIDKGEGDFEWEGRWYRPNDLFRVKVLAMAPKVSEDVLIPDHWVDLANERWKEWKENNWKVQDPLRLGVDVAGMGTDDTVYFPRYGWWVPSIKAIHSGGEANHMQIAGTTKNMLDANRRSKAFIDTIGEGAGVYSRLIELEHKNVFSYKNSFAAKDINDKPLTDITGEYQFVNMRAYTAWAIRDWLNPAFKSKACLPIDAELKQELTSIIVKIRSDGKRFLEKKEDIKARIGRSPGKFDALAQTFYPEPDEPEAAQDISKFFF
jgi:hypothetical protein